jgi:hypothetical protein
MIESPLPRPTQRALPDAPGLWRRNPYVYMLIAIPASVVVMAAIMIPLALATFDGVVVDDYYKRGLLIGQDMARDERASHLSLMASVHVDVEGGQLTVAFNGPMPPEAEAMRLALTHATRGGYDATLELSPVGDGTFAAELPELIPGRWHIELSAGEWRLRGQSLQPANETATLSASQ